MKGLKYVIPGILWATLILLTEQVIVEAYRRINIDAHVTNYPWPRAIETSNSGQADAELFRLPVIEKRYNHLLRVDIPIVNLELVATVADFAAY